MSEIYQFQHQGVTGRIVLTDCTHRPGTMPRKLCDLIKIKKGSVVADTGCGGGYLGIVAALLGASQVYSIDPMSAAIALTRKNAALNEVHCLEAILGEELNPILDKTLDTILANPPQTPFPQQLSQMRYGGEDGTTVIERIVAQASKTLAKNGRLYLSHVSYANPSKLQHILKGLNLQSETIYTERKHLCVDEKSRQHPGLAAHIKALWKSGRAELEEENGELFYRHRLHEISKLAQ